jgi:trans-aconitate methyltransferase
VNAADRRAYQERYAERLRRFGHDPRTLGWDKGKQPDRFAALTALLPLPRIRSVLDVGCGFGDLLPFLRQRGFVGQYTGLDFMPDLIEVGAAAYPEARFVVADFSEYTAEEPFDVVLASGIFNARLSGEDQWAYVTATLRRMHGLAAVTACADFLSSHVDFRREDLHYTSPEAVFTFARSLTRRVALLHHYMPFEFAAYLFRDDRVTENTLFPPLAPGGDAP